MRPFDAYYEASQKNKRIKKYEHLILTDPLVTYRYACDVIKGRWKKGEKSIIKDAKSCMLYARFVLVGKFKKGEKTILNSPEYKDEYINFLKALEKLNER